MSITFWYTQYILPPLPPLHHHSPFTLTGFYFKTNHVELCFHYFRDLDKKGSLNLQTKFLLMLRIIFDCVSRMAFLSAFMYSLDRNIFRLKVQTLFEKEIILHLKAWSGCNLLLWCFSYFDHFQYNIQREKNGDKSAVLDRQMYFLLIFFKLM